MQWTSEELTDLVIKYFTNQADARERALVEDFLLDPVQRNRIEEILSKENVEAELPFWREAEQKEPSSLASVLTTLQQHRKPAKSVPLRNWTLAAASVAAVVFSTILIRHYTKRQEVIPITIARDLKPGGQKATLILSSGKEVLLDSAQDGEIARESGSTVQKKAGGVIDYRKEVGDKAQNEEKGIAYNTLKTPRGGVYEVVLPDHSIAYLNSESSLKYPTVFSSLSPRVVELTGEAYFVVQHDPARPFRVNVAGREVDALGTSFDVNAYGDETVIKATLLEGVVRASDHKDSVMLRPGEQAQMLQSGLKVVTGVDTDCVVGWKNGDFVFNATPLGEVMRQLGRWYNVTVKYDSSKVSTGGGFTAEIPRNRPASEVLRALEVSGYHFTITGGDQIEAQAIKK